MTARFPRLALAALLVASAGCRRESPERHDSTPLPDIVLVSIDTLRADALGYAGNSRARTPNLDRIASEGKAFLFAHAHNVMTLPSHANILTGRYAYEHGVRDNDGFRLDPKWDTAATLLHGAGYATAAFIGAFPLDARFGLDRGFDVYDETYPQGANEYDFRVAERPAAEVVAAARRWYAENAGRQRFLFVHLYDCHSPHVPPPELAAAFASDPYAGEVAGVDAALGPLFEDLRAAAARHVLLLVTSDHGEALGDHGEETHGLFAYEATLHVPLIIWSPGVIPAARDTSPRRHVDILPTILGAAAVHEPPGLPGRSLLLAADAGAPSYFEALTASFTRGWAPLRGVLRGSEKFIDLPIPELYELRADPAEKDNLFEKKKEAAADLKRLLPPLESGSPAPASASEETAAKLRSLGYLSGGAALKKSYGPEDDPKRLVDLDRQLQQIVALYQGGKLREAVALAREAMKRRPTMPVLYEFLSYLEDQAGETSRATATLEEAKRRGFLDERLTTRLGLLYSQTGRTKEGVALLESLRGSKNPDVSNALGIALATAGDSSGAIATFQNALRLDPKNAVAWQNIGLTQLHARRPAEAIESFDKAFAINERLPRAWNGKGAALEALGRHSEAMEALKKAIALDPQQFEAMLNLGVVALEQGQKDLARDVLSRFLATAPPAVFAEDLTRARGLLREASR